MSDVKIDQQKLYNKALRALIRQGKASLGRKPTGELTCMYLANDGCRCGIGHLFPKRLRRAAMEFKQVDELLSSWGSELELYLGDASDEFLIKLQRAHDNSAIEDSRPVDCNARSPRDFLVALQDGARDLAGRYGLTRIPDRVWIDAIASASTTVPVIA